jgi:hypothetical protein
MIQPGSTALYEALYEPFFEAITEQLDEDLEELGRSLGVGEWPSPKDGCAETCAEPPTTAVVEKAAKQAPLRFKSPFEQDSWFRKSAGKIAPGATVAGVLKRTPNMARLSRHASAPKFSFPSGRQKLDSGPGGAQSNLGPGAYDVASGDRQLRKVPPAISFNGPARFQSGPIVTKKAPGPGSYDPRNPNTQMESAASFGAATRGNLVTQNNPGPGSYDDRSKALGRGAPMLTMRSRPPAASLTRSGSCPGPGAYQPEAAHTSVRSMRNAPRPTFGSSTRADGATSRKNLEQPGPGAYDMQSFKRTGTDVRGNPKIEMSERRPVINLESYVTPGPGSYNSQMSSFGF